MLPNLQFDCSMLAESFQANNSTDSLDSGFSSNSDEQLHEEPETEAGGTGFNDKVHLSMPSNLRLEQGLEVA